MGRMHSNVTHQGMTKIKKNTIILAKLFFITRWGEKKKKKQVKQRSFLPDMFYLFLEFLQEMEGNAIVLFS